MLHTKLVTKFWLRHDTSTMHINLIYSYMSIFELHKYFDILHIDDHLVAIVYLIRTGSEGICLEYFRTFQDINTWDYFIRINTIKWIYYGHIIGTKNFLKFF